MSETVLYAALGSAVLALVLAFYFARWVTAHPPGNERMVEIAAAIRSGAMTFLRREYTWVALFVLVMAILIASLLERGRPWGAVAFVFGAVLSALAGLIGMRIATAANTRTAEAARRGGVTTALPVAFRGGAVMGFTVAGLGLLGIGLGFLVFNNILGNTHWVDIVTAVVAINHTALAVKLNRLTNYLIIVVWRLLVA